MIDAIAFEYRTEIPWMACLSTSVGGRASTTGCGSGQLTADGTWKRVLTNLLAQADAEGGLDRVVAVDSTVVRAHQHSAGARKKGALIEEPGHHALGRSRAG
ncbi:MULTISPECIES: hypothetical protein [unclassified Streptomyces]|uniref:hypothetical protein n=1 Tax=unclassified Streptomyces TaxID=2593676 RepID=UPI003330AA73